MQTNDIPSISPKECVGRIYAKHWTIASRAGKQLDQFDPHTDAFLECVRHFQRYGWSAARIAEIMECGADVIESVAAEAKARFPELPYFFPPTFEKPDLFDAAMADDRRRAWPTAA